MTESEEGPVPGRALRRSALAEIPVRLEQLRVSPPPLNAHTNLINHFDNVNNANTPRRAFAPNVPRTDNTPAGVSSALLSPTPSPDELIIQQRGRRRFPVTWSPDIDFKKQSIFHSNSRTPPKNNLLSPSKNGVTLRSTPRKRLLMNDIDKPSLTPDKVDFNDTTTPQKLRNQSPSKLSPAVKRFRFDRKLPVDNDSPLDVVLKGMSNDQLIDIIKGMVQKRPDLEQELRNNLPVPDLKPLEEKLVDLKRNIYRSLPTSRLTSKTDSPAFSRAATHVSAFKKHLVDQGRNLVDSQHWQSVLEYALLSWSYVKATPLWDNHPHNSVRRQCFKYLTGLIVSALKKGQFDHQCLSDTQEKIEQMVSDSEDIQSCLKLIESLLNSGSQYVEKTRIPMRKL